MKAAIIYLVLFFSTFTSCNSQEVKNNHKKPEKNKPQESVIVNRKYDENGNLIEFDSTYTSYYSSFEGDTIRIDSIINQFPDFFNDEFFRLRSGSIFDPFFGQDSALHSYFFHDDFFEQQFINQNEDMIRMMQEMDSIKNIYFKRHSLTK